MTFRIPEAPVNPLSNTPPDSVTQDQGMRLLLEKFVRGATRDVLGRAATEREVTGWVSQLSGGVSRETLLKCLLHSVEKREQVIRYLHGLIYRRGPSAGQVRFWCDRLQAGASQDEILAQLCTSPEYTAVNGPRNAEFIRSLFRDLLDRRAESTEVDALIGLLDSFVATRREIALDFITSDEFRRKQVRAWFLTYLRREPDMYQIEVALEKLRQGFSIETVQAQIMGGREYFNLKALA